MTLARRSLFVSWSLILSGALLGAQAKPGKVFARYSRPLANVSIDLGSGTVTRAPTVHAKTARTTADFTNLDLSGFMGVDTGGGFCEWIDAGTKGVAGNASDLMNDILFAYCSAKLYAGSGGPGGSTRLGFYEGYTSGGGAPTTAVAAVTLTGLPANSTSSSFFGGFNCYFVHMTFGSLISFADGPIGYSWRFLDTGTTGTLAGTWPFLACVVSCSGVYGQVDGQGMTDSIDEYCPPGTLRTIFTFASGTLGATTSSMAMQIDEISDVSATRNDYDGESLNRDVLSASRAIVGGAWQPVVTIPGAAHGHGHGTSGLVQVKLRTTALLGPGGGPNFVSPLGGRLTETLIAGPQLAVVTGSHDGSLSSLAPQVIPLQIDFVCFHWAAQATVIGGGFADLSSATEGTTGTF